MSLIKQQFEEAHNLLGRFMADENNFQRIKEAGDIMTASINGGNTIFSCGNGGSMSDAMHFAEELSGRFRDDRPALPAIAIADPTHITCVANDYGFNQVFARYLQGLGKPGDTLLAISTSGNSPNILEAVKIARQKSMKIVALTGKNGGELKTLADVEIRVPHEGYSDRIQEIHIKIIHTLITYIEANT